MKRTTESPVKSWQDLKAKDVMKAPVVTLDDDVSLREAAQALSDDHIGGAPVVNLQGKPLGVVSLFDIATHLAGLERPAGEPGGFYRQGRVQVGGGEVETPEEGALDEATVADIMAPGLIGVRPEASLSDVARLLARKQIHRVFVLDGKGRLQGVISTMDILRVLAA
jgi:CBS domain-containing protein